MATTSHAFGPFYYASVPAAVARVTVSDLAVRRGVEGPQIILTWTKPEDHIQLDKVRIVRKMGSYPLDETDGKIVLDSTDVELEYYTDFPGYAPEYFYYKVFTLRGSTWISTALNEVVELAHDTQAEKQDKFFRELPEIHRTFDKARFGVNQVALDTEDLDVYEKIMLAEDGSTDQGELQRFLKLFNIFFNEPLALTRAIATRDGLGVVHDPVRTSPQNLDYIAKMYGWRFNFDLDVIAARAEVLSLPDMYSKKGRADVTEDFINNILTGHTVDLIIFDQVLDMNGYPERSLLDTGDIVAEVNFLTALNNIYVICDCTGDSTIGFSEIGINIVPDPNLKVKASMIQKLGLIIDEFFSILDDVFPIIHQTFTLNFPTDFTTAGVSTINTILGTGGSYLDPFKNQWYGYGEGDAEWDYFTTPTPQPGDTTLNDEVYRNSPRNVVYADSSWDPTTVTTGKRVLVRCFDDIETFSSLFNREVGLFYGGSQAVDTGVLLAEKFYPLRFANERVRYITDFRIQFP